MFFIFEFCFMKVRYVGDTVEQLSHRCAEKKEKKLIWIVFMAKPES
jgi:hypothetical protein